MGAADETIKIELDKESLKQIDRNLKIIGEKAIHRVVHQSTGKALRPVITDARKRVPVKHGLLKGSLGIKRLRYPRSGTFIAIAGARTGFAQVIDGKKHDPAFYAHLVELGTSKRPAKPFLRPAMIAQKGEVASRFQKSVSEKLEKEVKKLKGTK